MSDETKKHNQGDLDSDGIPILTHTIKTNTNEAPTPAALVGDYRLVREIGRGATAVVYLCEHINSGGEYAIKMLRQGIATDWHQKMLENEARLAGRLEHKNIAGICDAAPDKGYVVMEYINGKSLDQHSNEGTLLPVHTVVNIIKEVAEALNYSSRQNVLHLDIKPGNIIVSEDFSRIKVTDFGCASIDGSRDDAILVAGSINYISPEQLTPGAQIDARTDIYALGSVFYRLITGKVTYRSKENLALPEIIRLITSQPHVPVMEYRQDVDIEVVAIIDKMLQKKPEHRYASWFDVIFDLARLSADFAKSSKVLPGPAEEPAKPSEESTPPAAATVKRPPHIEQSTVDLVQACSLFAGLAEPDIYELIHHSNFRKLSPYESLMSEGEKGDMFYIILQGGLNMFKHGDMLLQPASGETIGEEVCFTELPGIYCFTVKAREHVSMLAMQKSMRRFLNNAVRDRLNEALLKSMNTKLLQLDAYEGKKRMPVRI